MTEATFEQRRQLTGFIIGPAVFILILLLPVPDVFLTAASKALNESTVTPHVIEAANGTRTVLALLLLMITWWITEAIPIPVTSLLPAVILPLFHVTGVSAGKLYPFDMKNSLISYANPIIFLFLGGFLLAAALRKCGLDKRITLFILTRGRLADSSRLIILGIMSVSAFLSMWISNTATAAMFLPLGIGILGLLGSEPGSSNMGKALMLGIAYSASIGGMGTIIGTPPNGIAVSILSASGLAKITFLDWMKFGVPMVIILIPITWLLLIKVFPPEVKSVPGGKELLMEEKRKLGRFSREEKIVISVFMLAVVLWISNPFWKYIMPSFVIEKLSWFDEYVIALFAALLLFIIPVNLKKLKFVLDWEDSKYVEWGILLLFGGGIALSDAMFRTGLAGFIATTFIGIAGKPSTLLLLFLVVLMIDFLTEVTSNTAVTSMMVPIIISIALTVGDDPVGLAVGAALAASLAFMLPVATPPNAIVYSSGYIKIREMIKAGFFLDITGWIVCIFVLYVFAHLIFGIVVL